VKTIAELMAALKAIVAAAEAEDRVLSDEEVAAYEAGEKELAAAQKTGELFARQTAYETPVIDGFPAVVIQGKRADPLDAAFSAYLRSGHASAELDALRFAQTEGSTTGGGFSVPDTFLTRLTEGRKAFGGFGQAAEQITTTTGAPLAWPSVVVELSTEADIAAEGAASAAGADFVFGEVTLGAYKYTSTGTGNVPVKVSVELLQDSSIDVAALVARKLGGRIARKQAYDLVRGSGSGEPLGIMFGTAGDVLTASGSVPTYAKLNTLVHALDPAYRQGASFLMNDATAGVLENIVDSQGRPILVNQTQGIADQVARPTLLGYPVIIDQAVANLANDVQGIGFGLWSVAYVVRHVRDVQILVNPYASVGYVVYDAWARMDGNVQDAAAYVTMEGLT